MTYDQLKDLPPKNLIHEVIKALMLTDDVQLVSDPSCYLDAPILLLVGDFEIRARFHDEPTGDTSSGELAPGDKRDLFGNIK
jgi:hypothetical protein